MVVVCCVLFVFGWLCYMCWCADVCVCLLLVVLVRGVCMPLLCCVCCCWFPVLCVVSLCCCCVVLRCIGVWCWVCVMVSDMLCGACCTCLRVCVCCCVLLSFVVCCVDWCCVVWCCVVMSCVVALWFVVWLRFVCSVLCV